LRGVFCMAGSRLNAQPALAAISAHEEEPANARGPPTLDVTPQCSLIVLMPIETLGDALTAGWRVHAKCIDGRVEQTHSTRKCHYTKELNLETLVWTRGRKMPLSDLKDRMMCPQCGGRRISIIFDPKPTARIQAV
jgi:hypothetical protein